MATIKVGLRQSKTNTGMKNSIGFYSNSNATIVQFLKIFIFIVTCIVAFLIILQDC